MRYYTYKVTFKDLPGYFYYGKHKDDGKPYFGSPKTWAFLWLCFEPDVQVLQWYGTEEEVYAAECSIILSTWKDKYSLNEAVGVHASENICRKNGKRVAAVMNAHPNTRAAGAENTKVMNAHPNTNAARVRSAKLNAKKASKRVLLTSLKSGETFEFPSAHEAARTLGLDFSNLCTVARGKARQHKGYTAVYL
jgi:hypothetical protein